MSIPKSIEIVRDFVIKVVVAVAAFLFLGGAAVALHSFTSIVALQRLVPPIVQSGLDGLEYAIFALDAICFGYFLIVETIRFLRDITSLLGSGSH